MTTKCTPYPYSLPLVKLNLGCGQDIKPGWTNLDGFVNDPRITHFDFLAPPWNIPTNHADHILASHILEHVPPILVKDGPTQRDLLWIIFEEMWRILKPNGILHIKTPYGLSHSAMGYLQHYRYYVHESFTFFDKCCNPQPAHDNMTHAHFHIESMRINRIAPRAPRFARIGPSKLGLLGHVGIRIPILKPITHQLSELELRMRCIKPHTT